MIICRTPYRISFFGGGTDYPAWFRTHGGAVLAATIDKYCYLTCRYLPPFFDHRFRIVYRAIETCNTVEEIGHPVVRAVLRHLEFDQGLELHHDGDLPARSGVGSSSAFTVGLLNALYALRGQMRTKMDLARESIHVEQDLVGETVGSQDQVMAAFGGLKYVQFHADGKITVDPVPLSTSRRSEFQSHLILLYTGIARTASRVAGSYVGTIGRKVREMKALRGLTEEGIDLLVGGGDLASFGELLHEAWQIKRGLSDKVTNPAVDSLYETAREAGALGGKLLGAGGGGFLLLFVPPERRADVLNALPRQIHVPFELEAGGSQIIFYEPAATPAEPAQTRPSRTASTLRVAS